MHDLSSLTPLGGAKPRIDKSGPFEIAEITDRALVAVTARHGQVEDAKRALEALIGFPLPDVGRAASRGGYAAFWIARGSWMIDADLSDQADLEQVVKSAVGAMASVVDQTDAWCRFDVTGPLAPDLFERLCAVPVRKMKMRDVARTQIEHLGCFLWCQEPLGSYAVIGPRSSARSLHHALISMARSVS